jgi:hypothetical protein
MPQVGFKLTIPVLQAGQYRAATGTGNKHVNTKLTPRTDTVTLRDAHTTFRKFENSNTVR